MDGLAIIHYLSTHPEGKMQYKDVLCFLQHSQYVVVVSMSLEEEGVWIESYHSFIR